MIDLHIGSSKSVPIVIKNDVEDLNYSNSVPTDFLRTTPLVSPQINNSPEMYEEEENSTCNFLSDQYVLDD